MPEPKASKFGKVVLAALGCVVLSLLGCCIFAIVGSQLDTDFQKQLADQKEVDKASILAMRGKLAALGAKLPAPGSLQGEAKVAAAMRARVGEVIVADAAFLAGFKPDGAMVCSDSGVFHDVDLLTLAKDLNDAARIGEWPDYQVDASARIVKRMTDRGVVAVFVGERLVMPSLDRTGFKTGVADGQLALISLEDGALIAHGPLHAESSDEVEVGGGLGIRIGPVHVGSVGGAGVEEAVTADFVARCDAAMTEAVSRLKAP